MSTVLDTTRTQAFAEQALGMVNSGCLSPREHAASLTRAAGPDNLAELAQAMAVLGQVETPLVEVFRKGGGVGYSAFERFHALMAESSRTTLEATLLTRTLPLVPGLVDRLDPVLTFSIWAAAKAWPSG
jgi:hypothetical protein